MNKLDYCSQHDHRIMRKQKLNLPMATNILIFVIFFFSCVGSQKLQYLSYGFFGTLMTLSQIAFSDAITAKKPYSRLWYGDDTNIDHRELVQFLWINILIIC